MSADGGHHRIERQDDRATLARDVVSAESDGRIDGEKRLAIVADRELAPVCRGSVRGLLSEPVHRTAKSAGPARCVRLAMKSITMPVRGNITIC